METILNSYSFCRIILCEAEQVTEILVLTCKTMCWDIRAGLLLSFFNFLETRGIVFVFLFETLSQMHTRSDSLTVTVFKGLSI